MDLFSPKKIILNKLSKAGGLDAALSFMWLEAVIAFAIMIAIVLITLVSVGTIPPAALLAAAGVLLLTWLYVYISLQNMYQKAAQAATKTPYGNLVLN